MKMAIFYVDGDYVDDSKAAIPLTDMAVLRGYAVFDFLRSYGGKAFHLDEHLLRLQNSAALLNIQCPWSLADLKRIVSETVKKNDFDEANVRLLITGGDSLDSITPLDKPRLVVMVTPVKPMPSEWYSDGVKIITADVTRYVPGAKSTNYVKAIMSLKGARESGAIESIYVNEFDQLLEGTTSNIFFVIDEELITTEKQILPGITRQVVLKLATGKIDINLRNITRKELNLCSEVFITSSNKEVVPVIEIDGISIGDKPGLLTRQVMGLFRQYTQSW
jgi:branched-chain amino acid aminotransferase